MLRESYTAVVARDEHWQGDAATEPYETAWAGEAIFFLRALAVEGDLAGVEARVQISADGIHWAEEGTLVPLPGATGTVTFCRVRHFGGWLRLAAELPAGCSARMLVSLSLKA